MSKIPIEPHMSKSPTFLFFPSNFEGKKQTIDTHKQDPRVTKKRSKKKGRKKQPSDIMKNKGGKRKRSTNLHREDCLAFSRGPGRESAWGEGKSGRERVRERASERASEGETESQCTVI
jgi:hypothetical protein